MWEDNIDWLPRALKGEIIDSIYIFEEGKVVESKNLVIIK